MPTENKSQSARPSSEASTLRLSNLLPNYVKCAQVSAMFKWIESRKGNALFCEGLCASASAVVFSALRKRELQPRLFLFILNDDEEAAYFFQDVARLSEDSADVLFFPSAYRRAVKYAQRDAAHEILRTSVLERLARPVERPLYVVSCPSALAERVAASTSLEDHTLVVREGGSFNLSELAHSLSDLGFRRTDYVYEPGEFAVRGSILDVYSFASELPFRIDFFGDDVESIRTFEVESQLSRERCSEVSIVAAMATEPDNGVSFTSLLPADTVLVTPDFQFVSERLRAIYDEGFSRQAVQAREDAEDNLPADLDKRKLLVTGEELTADLLSFRRIETVRPLGVPQSVVRFHTHPQPVYHKNFSLLSSSFADFKDKGYSLYICADSAKQLDRLRSILDEKAAPAETPLTFGCVGPTLHEGFSDDDQRTCIFTDHQIFDRYHKYSVGTETARNGKMALTLKELREFQPGDYVVHVDHGVGRFMGLVRIPASDGSMQEVIKIVYRGDDVVYVSIHALHKVSKYKSHEGEPPRLNQLGSGAWEKLKDRTKKKIKDIARDLIRLYSQRREEQGFAFSADNFMQQELEAGFAYEDTPDQLRVTQEVKSDMESHRPMDRLVCGDVGFGKTEIAVRAAFKAACDNKQVAVMVPTTVLALQHFKTFSERLKGFPVTVDYLTRARTPKQTRETLQALAEGRLDIIVGTHKLIGKSVRFKDLGLLIIDEEQKFGVSVKEKLRQMKVNVDTLTMSATPIPRTLQFSLMGARDFSVIQTPPPNRRPIQTELHTFSHEVIADAVNFEMSRGGQVFIVTNRVAALPNLKMLVEKYVPDARVAVGHGQMPPGELEQVVLDFINYDYDVLVSTTIVENGIDIPNANTIIIDAAQTFGLSDLHQMRGRVGRSNRKAFCYLLAPPLSSVRDDARRRLRAIETFSELGSGISIAMQDLEIRGAGNLLGAEQSGFIADLGYETYQKILSEAVTELKNDEFADLYSHEAVPAHALTGDFFVDECAVECEYHAYFPETYVPGSAERMLLYRELDGLSSQAQVEAFRQRMNDRFGPLPPEGEELLCVVPLRMKGRRLGMERIHLRAGRAVCYFVSNPDSAFYQSNMFSHVINYAMQHLRTSKLDEVKGKRRITIEGVASVSAALNMLTEMIEA